MEVMLSFFINNSMLIEFDICSILFLIPLQKKKYFWLRVVPMLILVIFMGAKAYALTVNVLHIHSGFSLGVDLFLVIALFYFTTELSPEDALFGMVCTFAVQNMNYNICEIAGILKPLGIVEAELREMLILMVLVIPSYFLFAKKLAPNGHFGRKWGEALLAFGIVIPFAFFMSMFASDLYRAAGEKAKGLYIICRLYAFLCCIFVL